MRLIFVDDQERMQFSLSFCKNIICPPALDTPSHKLAYATSLYTKMVGFEIDEKWGYVRVLSFTLTFFNNLIALSKSKIVEFLFIEILESRTSKQMSGCVCVATQFIWPIMLRSFCFYFSFKWRNFWYWQLMGISTNSIEFM